MAHASNNVVTAPTGPSQSAAHVLTLSQRGEIVAISVAAAELELGALFGRHVVAPARNQRAANALPHRLLAAFLGAKRIAAGRCRRRCAATRLVAGHGQRLVSLLVVGGRIVVGVVVVAAVHRAERVEHFDHAQEGASAVDQLVVHAEGCGGHSGG